MPVDFSKLKDALRLLMEATLKPLQGDRFQATGFPDLGPARYQLHDGTEMLLVESTQSMANRLEAVCWDEAKGDLIEDLKGLPYVRINLGELGTTTTIQEFHRLNSPYIWEGETDSKGQEFRKALMEAIGVKEQRKKKAEKDEDDAEGKEGKEGKDVPGVLDMRKLAAAVFKFDPNSVVHGVFLEKVAGRLRLTRALSAVIEAHNVRDAGSGGVKFDRVDPTGDAKLGFGHVPFHRTEFTAEAITAYFNLDLALLSGYGLPDPATDLLIALSLFKVRRFLDTGLRLRTACDLEMVNLCVQRPEGFCLPSSEHLAGAVKDLVKLCTEAKLFAEPPVTVIEWKPKSKPKPKKNKAEGSTAEAPEAEDENDEHTDE